MRLHIEAITMCKFTGNPVLPIVLPAFYTFHTVSMRNAFNITGIKQIIFVVYH